MTLQCSQILLFQTIITRMSDSLSPSGSDLIIDDEDLDSVSVTKEDLSEAEAKCGLATGGRVIARPGLVLQTEKSTPHSKSTFKFGGVGNVFPNIPVGPKVSSADPRTKYKPSGLLSLNKDAPPDYNNVDNNFNIMRTVQNSSGSSSFVKQQQQPDIPNKSKFTFGSVSPSNGQTLTTSKKFSFGASSFSPQLSPSSPSAGEDDGQEDELKNYMQMREAQEAKMKAEKEKMDRIEKLIERKKMEKQQQQMWHFDYQGQQGGTYDK